MTCRTVTRMEKYVKTTPISAKQYLGGHIQDKATQISTNVLYGNYEQITSPAECICRSMNTQIKTKSKNSKIMIQ